MENEIKRAKRRIIIAFSVLIAVLLIIAAAFCVYRYQHTFSQEKWLSNADGRYMIVDDMLEKHQLIGMSEADVIALLGAEDGDGPASFKLSDKKLSAGVHARVPSGRRVHGQHVAHNLDKRRNRRGIPHRRDLTLKQAL